MAATCWNMNDGSRGKGQRGLPAGACGAARPTGRPPHAALPSRSQVPGLPPNMVGKQKAKEWMSKLHSMAASYELTEEEVRQLLFDLESVSAAGEAWWLLRAAAAAAVTREFARCLTAQQVALNRSAASAALTVTGCALLQAYNEFMSSLPRGG